MVIEVWTTKSWLCNIPCKVSNPMPWGIGQEIQPRYFNFDFELNLLIEMKHFWFYLCKVFFLQINQSNITIICSSLRLREILITINNDDKYSKTLTTVMIGILDNLIFAGIPQGDFPETVCETLRDADKKNIIRCQNEMCNCGSIDGRRPSKEAREAY